MKEVLDRTESITKRHKQSKQTYLYKYTDICKHLFVFAVPNHLGEVPNNPLHMKDDFPFLPDSHWHFSVHGTP